MPYKNLIQSILPKAGAKEISSKFHPSVTFIEDMSKKTITSEFISLSKVNGQKVEADNSYDNKSKTVTIVPKESLENNTMYEIRILSGENGVSSIIGSNLASDVTSRFTIELYSEVPEVPSETKIEPKNVTIKEAAYGLETSWESNYNNFSIKVSDSNNNKKLWPKDDDEYETKDIRCLIPNILDPGDYLFWIRAFEIIDGKKEYTEDKPTPFKVNIQKDTEDTETPGVDSFNIEILKTFPEDNSILKDLTKMAVLFDTDIDVKGLPDNAISISSSDVDPMLASILGIELMPVVIDQVENGLESNNFLTFSIKEPNVFENGKKYSIDISKNIRKFNDSAVSIGTNKRISFIKQWEFFFCDVDTVRLLLGPFGEDVTDSDIAKLIAEISNQVYKMFSSRKNFDKDTWLANIPYYVPFYVQYKVAYMLTLNRVVRTASGEASTIQLGDLTVKDAGINSTELANLLKALKLELDKWEAMLNAEETAASFAGVGFSQKASEPQAYPNYFSRVPFTELGG